MHPKRILALLVASALPALALAAPQHPAANARPHPAISAHDTAIDAQASAMRIESCTEVSSAFIDQLVKGDYKAATGNFDDKLREALGPEKLGEVWQAVDTHYGKLESRGNPQNMMYQGLAVITVPLRFSNGTLSARLACAADGKFAGFHLVPVPSAAPATSG